MTDFKTVVKKNFPFKLKKEEFTGKIGLVSIGVSLIIIALIMSLFVLYTKQKREKELIVDGFALTNLVAEHSVDGLDRIEAGKLFKIVNMMGSKSGLIFGMVLDMDRRVIAHTDTLYIGHILNDPATSKAVASNSAIKQVYKDPNTNHTMYEFSRPVYTNGTMTGAVRLGFSKDINPLFSDSDIRGILLVAALIFSLVPIFYYLLRRALGSLVSLNDNLKNLLARNDFEKIEVNSDDATGKLVDRFNQAMSRLEDKYNTLKISHDDLDVANKVLFYEKDRIESIVDNIGDGIMVTDSVGSIILVNRTMAYLMKFTKNEVIGKTIIDCIDNEEIVSFIGKNQFNGGSFSQKNLEISLKQFGSENIVLISYLPLLSPEESVLGNIIIAKDITVEKMAQQNQSDFIAHVAHELRTPLTTIKSYVEMLMDDEVSDRNTKIEFFNTINDEANRLSRLINNLLNISKIEMGSLTVAKDLIKTLEFFKDIVKSIETQAISKNIKLESILPDKLSPLVMEKDLLRVAILNILGNAIKYTPETGSVTFRVEEDEDHIKIDIIDTGHGISKEELPSIFDKFFRSSDEKIKANTGNGLGLALSKEIIRLHNGNIDVNSNIGQGTHFTLLLPKEGSPRIGNYNKNYSSLVDN